MGDTYEHRATIGALSMPQISIQFSGMEGPQAGRSVRRKKVPGYLPYPAFLIRFKIMGQKHNYWESSIRSKIFFPLVLNNQKGKLKKAT